MSLTAEHVQLTCHLAPELLAWLSTPRRPPRTAAGSSVLSATARRAWNARGSSPGQSPDQRDGLRATAVRSDSPGTSSLELPVCRGSPGQCGCS
jgi:hypothetical protein